MTNRLNQVVTEVLSLLRALIEESEELRRVIVTQIALSSEPPPNSYYSLGKFTCGTEVLDGGFFGRCRSCHREWQLLFGVVITQWPVFEFRFLLKDGDYSYKRLPIEEIGFGDADPKTVINRLIMAISVLNSKEKAVQFFLQKAGLIF